MKPTEILYNEHRVIEQVLECLERMAREATTVGKLNAQSARNALAFFRNFADRCHHGKEEARLFPMMEARGFPREGGPTGVMRHEHEIGRAHVRAMAESLDAAASGDPAALLRFVENADGYCVLLRDHIQKEDHCLFPMADRAFSESDHKDLLAQFEQVEAEDMGAGTHEAYLLIANELADRYGVARAMREGCAGPGAGSCHHCHLHAAE